MRIAIDAIPLVSAKTGIGHYTDSLATWLARTHSDHTYDLISPFDFPFESPNGTRPPNLIKRFTPVRSLFRKWWLVGLPTLLQISPVDLFHGTNYCIPLWAPCPSVVTIHDLSLFTQSSTHEAENVRRGRRRIPVMARRADRIIVPSEWTKQETVAHLGIREDRISVIYEAARENMHPVAESEARQVLEKYKLTKPYLLYVGTIEPRKNLTVLIRAFDQVLRSTEHRPTLALCGGRGWLDDNVFRLVDELKIGDAVRFTGYVPDEDLPALYSQAEMFLYPSLYEGFGLPPLEAMACGAPVITSNTTSLPEVVGEAGLAISPRDWRALAAAIARWLGNPEERLYFRSVGLHRAAQFSWERAANETQTVYDEVFRKRQAQKR
jgi:glycosyltransferase involved in cell wall biosynthesis